MEPLEINILADFPSDEPLEIPFAPSFFEDEKPQKEGGNGQLRGG